MRSPGVLTAARGFVAGARRRSWPPLPAKLAIGFLVLLVAAAIAAPWIAPYPPDGIDLASATQPPSLAHVLGTDQMGRDVLSRLLFSARLSLVIVGAAVLLAGLLGCALGIIAGFSGGVVDAVIMRLTEIQYSLPAIIVALVTVGALGPSITNLVAVIALTNWPRFTRIVRGEAWRLRNRDFILLAHLAGASTRRVLWRHVTPNLLTTIYVLLTLDVGLVVLLEATLSFLGIGVQPPTPSWGNMVNENQTYFESAPWLVFLPGAAIGLLALSFNLIGDALRDILDPTLRGRH
jgi:peptide/nickel transport system permease protein